MLAREPTRGIGANGVRAFVALLVTGMSFGTVQAIGQIVQTDLMLEVASTGKQVTQTQTPALTLVARNNGPADATDVVIRVGIGNSVPNTLTNVVIEVDSRCAATVDPEVAGIRVVIFSVGNLPTGAARTCGLSLRALPTATRGSLGVGIRVFSPSVQDGFSNNDFAVLRFGIAPEDIVQDITLAIESPPGLFPGGSIGTVDFIVSNNGPGSDPVFGQIVLSEVYRYGLNSTEQWLIASIGDPDCEYFEDDLGGPNGGERTGQLNFPPVPAGESITCTLAVAARLGAQGRRSIQYRVLNEAPGTLDPNPDNNTAFLVFQFTALAVPASSRILLIVLALLLAFVGARRVGRGLR